MIDEHDVREMLQRRANAVPTIVVDAPKAARRARRRLALNGTVAVLAAAAIAVATFAGVDAMIRTARIPADDRSEELGIFAPVAGRIVYVNEADLGYDPGIWAVDPSGPADTTEGPTVADDAASTLVPLDLATVQGFENVTMFGWSSDGTELLFARIEEYSTENPFPKGYLYILHANGSETRLNSEPIDIDGAAISPDGKRVVYHEDGLFVVDADGGRPVRIAEGGAWPTFSPDGTRVAYLVYGDTVAQVGPEEEHVWVADADGGNAHEILANEPTVFLGVSGLQWSPAGDRLALGVGGFEGSDALAIYTFAPDGSDFTQVITGGDSPYWSPDGSQIAYTIHCSEHNDASCPEGSILRSQCDAQPTRFGGGSAGLAIADADGSNVREFGFAESGPWHPGVSAIDEPAPIPDDVDEVLDDA
jgi:dipeptidyl aminopeptidase/acylaminoacyl peptidase